MEYPKLIGPYKVKVYKLDSFQALKCEDSLRPQLFIQAHEATRLFLENGFSREGAPVGWGWGPGLMTAQKTQSGRPDSPLGFIHNPNCTLQEEQLLINPVMN